MKRSTSGTLSLDQLLSGLGPALFSSIRAPFGIFDRQRRIVWINRSMAFIHQCDAERVNGRQCSDVFTGCAHVCARCPLSAALEQGRTQVVESWMDVPGSGRRWGEVQVYPVRDRDRNVSAAIVLVFETTKSKRVLQHQKKYTELLELQLRGSEARSGTAARQTAVGTPPAKLTRRESDVLRLVTEGYTNVQIADVLKISAHTVKSHVNSLFNKLGVNDRTQAAVLAARNNLA